MSMSPNTKRAITRRIGSGWKLLETFELPILGWELDEHVWAVRDSGDGTIFFTTDHGSLTTMTQDELLERMQALMQGSLDQIRRFNLIDHNHPKDDT